jgi:hypothetical protein
MLADMLLEFRRPGDALAQYKAALKLSQIRSTDHTTRAERRTRRTGSGRRRRKAIYSTLLKSAVNGANSPGIRPARSFVESP